MSDDALPELERKFTETGALEDEVALLRGRLGGTDPAFEKRLKCAAFFGHAAATQALDIAPTPEWELRDTDIWISRLKPLGKEAFVRTVVAIARSRSAEWDRPDDARPRAAVESAEAWAVCPCEDHRKAAEKAHEAAGSGNGPAEIAALAAKCAGRTVAAGAQQDLYQALKNLDPQTMPKIVAAALIPWVLGRGDPIGAGATAAAPVAAELSADEKAALGVVVQKLKQDPAALVRALAGSLTAEERADLARRILERRVFDN